MSVESVSALVVGGTGPGTLRATLKRLGLRPNRIWCVVPAGAESEVAVRMAQVHTLDPWPGGREALDLLHRAVRRSLPQGAVLIVASGTLVTPRFLPEAHKLIERGSGLVIGAADRVQAGQSGGSPFGPLSRRLMSDVAVRPGSGIVVRADVLDALAAQGWLQGAQVTVAGVRRVAGRIRYVKHAFEPAPKPSPIRRRRDTGTELTVTVLIAAHNEQAWIGDTLRSLRRQTRPPADVVVIDDCSTDRTADVARHLGARVLRTPHQSRKAGALNHGLGQVATDAVVTTDADTALHPDAIDRLMSGLEAGKDAVCGAVFPANERGMWGRGRLVEYASAFRLWKRAQNSLGHPFVLSGCIAAFRTEMLHRAGGFSSRTITEDVDLTWTLDQMGCRMGYVPKALAYPVEPSSWPVYKAQVRRWASANFQSVALHARTLLRHPGLAFVVVSMIAESLVYFPALVVTSFMAILGDSTWLRVVLTLQALAVAVELVVAATVVGIPRVVRATPGFLLIRYTSPYLHLEAFIREILLRRRLSVWVKGH